MYMCCQSRSISKGFWPMTLPARSRTRSGDPPSPMPVMPISVSTVTSRALWLNERFMLGCAQHFTRVILALGSAASDRRADHSVAPTPAARDFSRVLRSIIECPFRKHRRSETGLSVPYPRSSVTERVTTVAGGKLCARPSAVLVSKHRVGRTTLLSWGDVGGLEDFLADRRNGVRDQRCSGDAVRRALSKAASPRTARACQVGRRRQPRRHH